MRLDNPGACHERLLRRVTKKAAPSAGAAARRKTSALANPTEGTWRVAGEISMSHVRLLPRWWREAGRLASRRRNDISFASRRKTFRRESESPDHAAVEAARPCVVQVQVADLRVGEHPGDGLLDLGSVHDVAVHHHAVTVVRADREQPVPEHDRN